MVSFAQIQKGVAAFVDREVIPSLSAVEKVIVGTGVGVITAKLPDVLKKYADHPLFAALNQSR